MTESDAVPDDVYEEGAGPRGLSRRTLIKGAAVTAGVATVTYFWLEGMGNPARRRFVEPTEAGEPGQALTDLERRTLAAVQDRILPSSPGSPGARDVNAIGYLDALMVSDFIRPYSKQLVRWGTADIHRRSRREHGNEFASLPVATQDALLHEYEDHEAGVRWLNKVTAFTLEGFFGDPIYGSNPEGIAWQWAQHRPGFPRPTRPGWAPEER